MNENTYILTKDGELYHYGVLGMKLGIRRAQKRGETYQYRSMGQKKYEKKLAKQTQQGTSAEKISKTKTKLETLKTRDKNRQSYAESTSTGAAVARGLLLGAFGTGTYNRLRASGRSVASSAGLAFLSNYFTPVIGIGISRAAEFERAKGNTKHR